MKNVLAIARREFAVTFASPLAYVVLGIFVFVVSLKFFFFPGVFFFGRASFRSFFDWMPAILAVLAPALTMRMLAEERKSGTIEVLLTMPVREHEVALGKWLAATGILAVGLLVTFPLTFLVAPLAAPGQGFDWGPVFGGYIGALLLGGAFAAVGLFASSLTRNQVVAFVLAAMLCAFNLVLSFFIVVLPTWLGEPIQYLSAFYHFESLGRGVIDWRDVLFFVSLIAIMVLLTTRVLQTVRRPGSDPVGSGALVLVIGSILIANALAVRLPLRLDLTRDRMFTLAEATRDTMRGLEAPVVVTAYFTKDLPPPFSDNARFVKDLLEEYRAASRGNLSFSFVDPMSTETEEDKEKKKDVKRDIFGRVVREKTSVEKDLEALNIQPVEVRVLEEDQAQTKRAYMGIAIRYGEEKESLPVVQDTSSLEYDLTSVIRRLTRTKTPVLGIIQGHGEPSPEAELQRLKQALEVNYTIRPITLAGEAARIDDDVDAVLVIGPDSAYSQAELQAIDDFVMTGKAAGFFLDRSRVDLRSFQPTPVAHGVEALVASWGLELGGQLLADVQCASLSVSERRGPFTFQRPIEYPFIPMLRALEGDSPLTRGIVGVTLPFATPVYPKEVPGVKTTVLARSTKQSWLEDARAEALSPQRDWASADVAFTGPYTLMATAQGSLPSHFKQGEKAATEARVFVVGSSTMLNEQVLGPPNAALFLNLMDWLVLDPKLLAMRSRGVGEAPIDPELSDGARSTIKGLGLGLGVVLLLIGGALNLLRRRALRARLAAG